MEIILKLRQRVDKACITVDPRPCTPFYNIINQGHFNPLCYITGLYQFYCLGPQINRAVKSITGYPVARIDRTDILTWFIATPDKAFFIGVQSA